MLSAKLRKLLDSAHTKKPRRAPFIYDGPELQEEASNWLSRHRRSEKLDREMADWQEAIVSAIGPWRELTCANTGEHHPSVVIETEAGGVRITFQSRFAKIDAAREAQLRGELGDAFDTFFTEEVSLKLKKAIADDPVQLKSVLKKLAALAGDSFAEWFECERIFVPTPAFAIEAPLDAEVREELGIKQIVKIAEAK